MKLGTIKIVIKNYLLKPEKRKPNTDSRFSSLN